MQPVFFSRLVVYLSIYAGQLLKLTCPKGPTPEQPALAHLGKVAGESPVLSNVLSSKKRMMRS